VTDDYLSKEFAKYRDASEAYKDMPAAQRPGFHEIRSYGAHLTKRPATAPRK
jgi:hypothetical protein